MDVDSVKNETGRVNEDTDCVTKVKGQILENQGKLAAFESDSPTLDQTLKLTQQETQILSTKLVEKSAYPKSIGEGLFKQLKEQQEWADSQSISSDIPEGLMTVVPLQRPDELNIPNPSWMQTSSGYEDAYCEKGIPTMITWSSGGREVAVEGSWDDWKSSKALQRSCKDFTIMKVLPSGVYQYRFIVDGQWRYSPDMPWNQDESGHAYNILDLQTLKLTQQETQCLSTKLVEKSAYHKSIGEGMFKQLKEQQEWADSQSISSDIPEGLALYRARPMNYISEAKSMQNLDGEASQIRKLMPLDVESQSFSTKLVEKRAYQKEIAEGMFKQLKEQQEWADSQSISSKIPKGLGLVRSRFYSSYMKRK